MLGLFSPLPETRRSVRSNVSIRPQIASALHALINTLSRG
jgi:hypothetical protein